MLCFYCLYFRFQITFLQFPEKVQDIFLAAQLVLQLFKMTGYIPDRPYIFFGGGGGDFVLSEVIHSFEILSIFRQKDQSSFQWNYFLESTQSLVSDWICFLELLSVSRMFLKFIFCPIYTRLVDRKSNTHICFTHIFYKTTNPIMDRQIIEITYNYWNQN